MVLKHVYQKYENQIIAAGFIIALFVFIALRYDFYYELNDDVFMKNILSGVYTGVPEGHNIQMQYPISFFISILYRLFPRAPVYGICLCLLQFACLYLLVERNLSFRRKLWSKLLTAGIVCMLVLALFLKHLVIVHYTVTSGLLAAVAVFLFMTTQDGISTKDFIKRNIISMVLAIISFGIRSEMLLLVLPLICVAGIYKWSKEKNIFSIENIRKYLTIIGGMLAGIIVVFVIHTIAYSGKDWKVFMQFFNSRTELYDFQEIPSYEENKELYNQLDMTENELEMLIKQYNFGLDDTIDAKILDALADYQKQLNKETYNLKKTIRESIYQYCYRLFHKESADYPWNMMVLSGYVLVLAAGIWNSFNREEGRRRGIVQIGWKLAFLGFIRSGLWMFIIIRGRTPERITHSLYLVEFSILCAMLLLEGIQIKASAVFIAAVSLLSVLILPAELIKVDVEYAGRLHANRTDLAMKEYCQSHLENFYFIDVYSSVSDPVTHIPYSEKIFLSDGNKLANYDIMGGWLTKSPLYDKKLKAFGMESMQEALIGNRNVYLMIELEKGTDLLVDFYKEQNIVVHTELTDTINGIIGVYKVVTTGEDLVRR